MRTVLYSAKAGQGTTVAAALLALEIARAAEAGPVVLADFSGGAEDLFPTARQPRGIAQWLEEDRTAAGLDNMLVPIVNGLVLLPSGDGYWPAADRSAGAVLSGWLGTKVSVVDAGTLSGDRRSPARQLAREIAVQAERRILVTQPCVTALRRAALDPKLPSPDSIALIDQSGRMLQAAEVEQAVGKPVAATVPWSPQIAAAADAGELHTVSLAQPSSP